MKKSITKSKNFTLKDSLDFSSITGDYNPIHLNEEYARRSIAGKPVVHGVNLIFWALNEYLKIKKKKIQIKNINAIFNKFILIKEKVKMKISKDIKKKVMIEFFNSENYAKISFNYKIIKNINNKVISKEKVKKFSSKFNEFSKLANIIKHRAKVFKEEPLLNRKILQKKFIYLFKYCNLDQSLDLSAITRFVGMRVPGLNSILYSIKLNSNKNRDEINFKIKNYDKRFNLINLFMKGLSFEGSIMTFIRPNNKNKKLSKFPKIPKNFFSSQRSLVIGGTKGLGESTVNILSNGSAKILLSYYSGKKDALKLRKKNTDIFYLNIEKNLNSEQIKKIRKFKPTHLYYFATPKIFVGEAMNFNVKKFDYFNKYYLTGFDKIFQIVDKENLKIVFSPSSIAVNKPTGKLFEYACSKSAMETYFNYLNNKFPSIQFYYPQLEKIRTEQTLTTFNEKMKSPDIEITKYLKKIK